MDPLPEYEPKTRAPRKKIQRKNNGSPDWVRAKMSSEEMTRRRLEGLRKYIEANGGVKPTRIQGQPDGMRKKEYLRLRAEASVKAKKVMKIMADKNVWVADNDKAHQAMDVAVEILLCKEGSMQHRLAAAKTILDFTQTKPVVKNETTLKSAESFLADLLKEDAGDNKP